MAAQDITISLSIDGDAKAEAAAGLYRYNVEATGTEERAPVGAELRDASGKPLGGL